MTTDTTGGYFATVNGYAVPDREAGDPRPFRYDSATDAQDVAEEAAIDATNWYGLHDLTAAAVPAADYVPPAPPAAPGPLTPAQLSTLNNVYAPPVAKLSYTYAIRLADGLLSAIPPTSPTGAATPSGTTATKPSAYSAHSRPRPPSAACSPPDSTWSPRPPSPP